MKLFEKMKSAVSSAWQGVSSFCSSAKTKAVAAVTVVTTTVAPHVHAQGATAESTLTDGVAAIVASGVAVGVAALGIFLARQIFPVVKKFWNSGK